MVSLTKGLTVYFIKTLFNTFCLFFNVTLLVENHQLDTCKIDFSTNFQFQGLSVLCLLFKTKSFYIFFFQKPNFRVYFIRSVPFDIIYFNKYNIKHDCKLYQKGHQLYVLYISNNTNVTHVYIDFKSKLKTISV